MFDRGLTFGSTVNIGVCIDNGWLVTPTGSSLGDIDPPCISRFDENGTRVSGAAPTKEIILHQAIYGERPRGCRSSSARHPFGGGELSRRHRS